MDVLTRLGSANALAQLAAGLVLGEPSRRLASQLFESLAPALELDIYVHYIREPGLPHLTLAGWHGISDDQAASIDTLEIGEAVCGMVAQRGEPKAVADIALSTEPEFGLLREFGLAAYVCHPLLARAEVIGTLSFGSRNRNSFDDDEVSLLRTASDILAAGLARSRAESTADDVRRELVELRCRLAAAEERADQLQHALDSRVAIEQAKGMLAQRHGVSVGAAFELLRRYARDGQLNIHVAAAQVIEGTSLRGD